MIHKFSIFPFRRSAKRTSVLPMDFGTMYFLYPSESSYFYGIESMGIAGRVVRALKSLTCKKSGCGCELL